MLLLTLLPQEHGLFLLRWPTLPLRVVEERCVGVKEQLPAFINQNLSNNKPRSRCCSWCCFSSSYSFRRRAPGHLLLFAGTVSYGSIFDLVVDPKGMFALTCGQNRQVTTQQHNTTTTAGVVACVIEHVFPRYNYQIVHRHVLCSIHWLSQSCR